MKFLANFFEDPKSTTDTSDIADLNDCNDPGHLDDPMGRNQD